MIVHVRVTPNVRCFENVWIGGTRFHTLLDMTWSKAKSLSSLFEIEKDVTRTVSRVAYVSVNSIVLIFYLLLVVFSAMLIA